MDSNDCLATTVNLHIISDLLAQNLQEVNWSELKGTTATTVFARFRDILLNAFYLCMYARKKDTDNAVQEIQHSTHE